jgi:DNA-binding CsgD family transcriptional regulator
MGKSKTLRLQDVRSIIRLVRECCDFGDDPVVWREHFVECAAQAVGVGVAEVGEWNLQLGLGNHGEVLGNVAWGWQNGFEKQAWEDLMLAFRVKGPAFNPMWEPYLVTMMEENGVCLTRTDLVEEKTWYRSSYFQDYHRVIGGDSTMYCNFASPNLENRVLAITLVRPVDEPDFTLRDRTFIAELQRAIALLVGGPLASFSEPRVADLSPRQRQVLACLLEGDSDKQIAKRLDISGHTVNQHVKAIFKHFLVSSRGELLARWIRRGWGTRFGWLEDIVQQKGSRPSHGSDFAHFASFPFEKFW